MHTILVLFVFSVIVYDTRSCVVLRTVPNAIAKAYFVISSFRRSDFFSISIKAVTRCQTVYVDDLWLMLLHELLLLCTSCVSIIPLILFRSVVLKNSESVDLPENAFPFIV